MDDWDKLRVDLASYDLWHLEWSQEVYEKFEKVWHDMLLA